MPRSNPDDAPQIAAALAEIPFGAIAGGVVTFRLPRGVNLTSLEQRYQMLLQPRNLNVFLASDDGRARLRQVGLPAGARLFTDYTLIGQIRRSRASEIFCIRPRRELSILISALSSAIRLEMSRLLKTAA